jgi:hypothetical protein
MTVTLSGVRRSEGGKEWAKGFHPHEEDREI